MLFHDAKQRRGWVWALLVVAVLWIPGRSPLFAEGISYAHFESGHVRPLALSRDGKRIYAVNTPDQHLEIFEWRGGELSLLGDVLVGCEPVAVAVSNDAHSKHAGNENDGVAYVVNHLSDSVSVVDVRDPARARIVETLMVGDEPRDIVVAGADREFIFVTCARRGQHRPGPAEFGTPGIGRADVWVFDRRDFNVAPVLVTLFCDTPRALAVSPDGRTVYAASFASGNRTTVLNELAVSPFWFFLIGDGFISPGLPPPFESSDGESGPNTGLIVQYDGDGWRDDAGRDWSPRVRVALSDRDVFAIDATQSPPRVVREVSGVGTTIYALATHPEDGRIFALNTESRNHIRFEPRLRGQFIENRVSLIDASVIGTGGVTSVDLNPHIDREQAFGSDAEKARSLSLPVAAAYDAASSELWVAAFGSGKIAVLSDDAEVLERIEVGGGPSGLVIDEAARRLYVMLRFDHAIVVIDLDTRRVLARRQLRHDPEPAEIREGRRLFYDAAFSSGHGDSSCASCHVYAGNDAIAWDLGDPGGVFTPNALVPVSLRIPVPLTGVHPLKGPMMTQSLRGLEGAGAMHWRGDRNGGFAAPFSEEEAFRAFQPVFQSLLGREDPYPDDAMEALAAFVLPLRYPPSPVAPLSGALSPDQSAGRAIFFSDGNPGGIGGDGESCAACHASAIGTRGEAVRAGQQVMKVPHLRGLYEKVGFFGTAVPEMLEAGPPPTLEDRPTRPAGEQVRGFGFTHDGSVPTLDHFFRDPQVRFVFPDEEDRSSAEKIRQLESFLFAFPTGMASAVGQQVTLHEASPESAMETLNLLEARALAGAGDLILAGRWNGEAQGYLLLRRGVYAGDRRGERIDVEILLAAVRDSGAIFTATLLPPGAGSRVALDRDEDGWYNRDEVDAGFDPADASSHPDGPVLLLGDCNLDSRLDISDAIRTLGGLFGGEPMFECRRACDANSDGWLDISDAVYSLSFLFRGGPAPQGYPGCSVGEASCRSSCVAV